MNTPIYLDYNATTPVAPEVFDAMEPWLRGGLGNPSSAHPYGRAAREAVERARSEVAGLLGAEPAEILFTGGGTESNNLALIGAARALRPRGRHLVTTAVEHPAVLEVCRWLERAEGFALTVVPVDGAGLVDPEDVRRALRPETILVSVMHANNEVGAIQPVAAVAAHCRAAGVLLHSDAAQSAGKIPVDVNALGADLLTLAGHKLYAPKGVGALYVRRGVRLEPVLFGAGQEGGRRPGTENVPFIAGLGRACALAAGGEGSPPRPPAPHPRPALGAAGGGGPGHPPARAGPRRQRPGRGPAEHPERGLRRGAGLGPPGGPAGGGRLRRGSLPRRRGQALGDSGRHGRAGALRPGHGPVLHRPAHHRGRGPPGRRGDRRRRPPAPGLIWTSGHLATHPACT